MDIIPTELLNGIGVVGLCAAGAFWFFRSLTTGKLCTGRELTEKNQRIEALETALHTRDEQVNAALAVMPEITALLRDAVLRDRPERAP